MFNEQRPALTAGNRIYLYNLLRQTIGCGKQTFMTRVEEALAAEALKPASMGFADVRELMEELSDFVQLTVFKGGRVYVTVVAQPTWDEALDTEEPASGKQAAGQGKPWKRKRGNKTVKAVRPRHVPTVVEPEPEPESAPEAMRAAKPAPETEPEPKPELEPDPLTAQEPAISLQPATAQEPAATQEPATVPQPAPEVETETQLASGSKTEAEPASEPAISCIESSMPASDAIAAESYEAAIAAKELTQPVPEDAEPEAAPAPSSPSISLTITYVPEDLDVGETEDARANADSASDANQVPSIASAEHGAAACTSDSRIPKNMIPRNDGDLPEGFPRDFTTDVYCPAPLLRELGYLLPYGADALGILNEYYYIAHLRGELEHGRGQAAFPLRYTQDGLRTSATVRIRRRTAGTPGAPWEITAIEDSEPAG